MRPKAGPRVSAWWAAGLGVALGAAAAGGWFALRAPPLATGGGPPGLAPVAFAPPSVPAAPEPVPAPSSPAPTIPAAQAMAPPRPPLPPLATEAEILSRAPAVTEVYRFAPQSQIVVLQFATLAEQAATLNRVAAMLERAGFPRDKVLDGAELDRRIRASGSKPETLYFGHDYRAADLVRFFMDAERDGVALTDQERWLQGAMRDWGWRPGVNGALISLVREDIAAGVDAASRATILRHELSHGQYFTNVEYAAYARRFWDGTLTDPERRRFRAFLGSEGYDTAQDDLMVNETQAYLMHTLDNRFFNATAVGMTTTRLDGLRVLFLSGMPPSWLRDCTVLPGRAPRRRRQRRGAVRMGRMKADTRAPPRTAWSRLARNSLT
jgi:hypothetical protein